MSFMNSLRLAQQERDKAEAEKEAQQAAAEQFKWSAADAQNCDVLAQIMCDVFGMSDGDFSFDPADSAVVKFGDALSLHVWDKRVDGLLRVAHEWDGRWLNLRGRLTCFYSGGTAEQDVQFYQANFPSGNNVLTPDVLLRFRAEFADAIDKVTALAQTWEERDRAEANAVALPAWWAEMTETEKREEQAALERLRDNLIQRGFTPESLQINGAMLNVAGLAYMWIDAANNVRFSGDYHRNRPIPVRILTDKFDGWPNDMLRQVLMTAWENRDQRSTEQRFLNALSDYIYSVTGEGA